MNYDSIYDVKNELVIIIIRDFFKRWI